MIVRVGGRARLIGLHAIPLLIHEDLIPSVGRKWRDNLWIFTPGGLKRVLKFFEQIFNSVPLLIL